jgi:hypothetical protein
MPMAASVANGLSVRLTMPIAPTQPGRSPNRRTEISHPTADDATETTDNRYPAVILGRLGIGRGLPMLGYPLK